MQKKSFSGNLGTRRMSRPSYSIFQDVEFQRFLRQSQVGCREVAIKYIDPKDQQWNEASYRVMKLISEPHSHIPPDDSGGLDYPAWWTRQRICDCLRSLPENTTWNCFICVSVLLAIALVVIDFKSSPAKNDLYLLEVGYNVAYAVHVAASAYDVFIVMENIDVSLCTKLGFLVDFVSYLQYAIVMGNYKLFKFFCYYMRLHRPFQYLRALNDYNLKGSILGTTLKYCYIFFVLRLTWAVIWTQIDEIEKHWSYIEQDPTLSGQHLEALTAKEWSRWFANSTARYFFNAIYVVNKMFIPIGPSVAPANDLERIACLSVMMTGCLVVTGAAVASLSLVISIYMRPEEAFRARYRLIIKEMKTSNIPPSLQEKVETFYKMYWHKQRAVSATQLLPTFPPTLPATVYTDIYFEATQKSRILRDLSYQFLSEVAKKMNTIHYIPGDTIIKRKTRKSSIIYIAYGDIEMLSAEDDSTAMVRMTRGTAVAGCAGNTAAACARAHAAIRAATFCTAHALHAPDLWRLAVKYGRNTEQTDIMLGSFNQHLERVKKHYSRKIPEEVKYKSSILHFKRNLMALKEKRDKDGKLLLERADVFLEVAGSYIMRNRADGSQTDEADAICFRSTFPCILQPSSSLQTAWHSLMCFVIVTVCFTHPYYLVFKKTVPLGFRFYDYVVTVLYVVDLIVHLSTGANVEDGVPITFAQTSSQQMRSQWFVLDVLGTLPIFEFIGKGHFAGINKLMRLPKVFRVLKSMEEMSVYHSNVLRFLSYTLLLLVACYLIAALQQGFMCFQFGYCRVTNFTHPPYWDQSELDEETVEHRLTFALYWAISMITFTSHMETWGMTRLDSALHTMLVLEICVVLHIFMEAVYSATIMVTTALREDYDSCIANVKDFLIRNEVDPLLRKRFITYLQLCWYTDKAYSMTNKRSSIFYDLPPHVHQDIVTRQRSKYLLSIPFMKLLNREDLRDVSSKAKLFYTSPNEILINTGDISNEMYLIKQGICEIVSPDTKEAMGSLGEKNHFGVLECLLRLPAFYTVRAVTHVQVFSIAKKVLLKAMDMPQIRDAIEFAKEQPEYSRLCSRRESFLRYEPPAPVPNRERFRLPRKYEEDYAFLHPFYRLGFFSSLRYIFPRFTLRPDGQYLVRYEWFRAACALLSAMLFPSYTYLVLQFPGLYFFSLLLDLSAYFDIVQRMLVGYYNQRGLLVYHPASTAAHYLKGAFFVDMFACLPLENLESPLRESFEDKYCLTQSRQILMLNRLLQLYRLPGAMYNIGAFIERRDIILVLKAIPLFMALLNALTSFMVFNSVNIFSTEDSDTWIIKPLADKGGSWLNHFNNTFRFNLTETPWNLHLATYFWVVYETTTTGYNKFNPSNFQLMDILFIGMVIGAMITTYFSVRIISIRANVNKELAAYQEHMKDIYHFMHREKLNKDLQKEVMDYYEYNWERMGGVDYTSVLKLCDQITLRTDAILHIYGPTFAKCPFLSNCDVSLVRMLGRAVRSAYFLRGMQIVEKDDVISNIYFVDQGSVIVRQTQDNDSTTTRLYRGSVFGNLDKLETVRCPVSIEAMVRVHALQINTITFNYIIADFPQVANSMKKFLENNKSFITGDKESLTQDWSSSSLFSTRRGLIRYLYLKDKYVQMYLIAVSLVCVFADLYNAGFQCNSMPLVLVLYGLDMGFYLKIIMQYSLPHIAGMDDLKEILLPIRKTYFQKEFKFDMVSCLPLELLSLAGGRYRWLAFSLLRLNRLFRIVTVYKCLQRHNSRITVNLTLSTVFSVFVWFTLFVHTAACVWYFISLVEDNAKANSSWIYNDKGESWCQNQYVCSVYFVLTTFTQNGVGDIMPKNYAEVMFVSLLQIISTLVYMVYVGEFSNIIQFQSFRSFSFYCKYLELQEFLKNNRVSKNLVTVVNRYTLHLWRESRGMQVPHFLKNAPQCLKLQIMSAAYIQHLNDNPVFGECEPAFLRQLVGCLQLFTYNDGMYVVKENEITDAMYLIHTGRVVETCADEGDRRTRTPGECFGVEQGLIYDTPYTYSYRTVVKSQVLTLLLVEWEYLLEHFPKSREIIYKYLRRDDDYPNRPSRRAKTQSVGDESRWHDLQSGMMGSSPGSGSTTPKTPATATFVPLTEVSANTDAPRPEITTSPPSTTTGIRASTSTADIPEPLAAGLKRTETKIPQEPAEPKFHPPVNTESSILASILQAMLKAVFPSPDDQTAEPTTIVRKTTQPKIGSTEPIASQSYSAHSLKITELPPSSTAIAERTEPQQKPNIKQGTTSKVPLVSLLPDTEETRNIPPESSYVFETTLPMTEQEDLSADNALTEVPSENMQFLWPIDSRASTEIKPYRYRDSLSAEKNVSDSSQSIRSITSQISLEENRKEGEPRDIDEALRRPSNLIQKMETRAKQLFGKKTESDKVLESDESSDKDSLLMVEDEEATSALLHKIRKESRIALEKEMTNNKKQKTDNPEISEIEPTQPAKMKSENLKLLKPSMVKSSRPTKDEMLAVVPYDESASRPPPSFANSKEEPTSTSRLKRSVHYKEEKLTDDNRFSTSDQDSESSLVLQPKEPSSEEKKGKDKKD